MRSDPAVERASGQELEEILAGVRDRLEAVEDALAAAARVPEIPLLQSILQSILQAPGKRLRPALVVLVCDLLGVSGDAPISLAAGTEVLHSATLVHDDIVDAADARRGRPTAHVQWSERAAVLAGDFLFATSADLVAQLDRPPIVRLFAHTIHRISRSEFISPTGDGDLDPVYEQYLAKIGDKTASLFVLGCDAAAELADAPDEQRRALHEYGRSLGMAFQMADDILDVAGDAAETGKPVGGDLRAGALTLPVIMHLLRDPAADGIVRRVVNGAATEEADVQAALASLRESGAIADSRRIASEHADRARAALGRLPAGASLDALHGLVDYAIDRSR